MVTDAEIKEILENHKNVAVVGLSHEKSKYSYIGIINDEAARKAVASGLTVVMNKCMMIEYGRLIQKEREEGKEIKTAELIQLSDFKL